MKYPDVKSAHIVPKSYLRGWAVDDKLVMHLPQKDTSYLKAIEDVATRNRAYRRTRPVSGEKIDDVEWSLSQLEAHAAPVLQTFVGNPEWPLPKEEKLKIASLLAMQTLRGADGQVWLEKLARELHLERGLERPVDTDKLTMMLKLSLSVAAVLGSMQWLLIEFDARFSRPRTSR